MIMYTKLIMYIIIYQTMFTIETTNPVHFQLDIQITHYDNIVTIVLDSRDRKFIIQKIT